MGEITSISIQQRMTIIKEKDKIIYIAIACHSLLNVDIGVLNGQATRIAVWVTYKAGPVGTAKN